MFKIIGSDQKEYGPVSFDQVRQWIATGRAIASTKAQLDGGEWKTLGEFPEYAGALSAGTRPMSPPASPPPLSPADVKTSGMAIASLVLGILGIISCGITPLIGLILGILAVRNVRNSKGALVGEGIAIAGTIISALFLVFGFGMAAGIVIPSFVRGRQQAMANACMNNLRQLSVATRMYSAAHEEHFPAATNWCDAVKEYVGGNTRVYTCAAANSTDGCDYAFNAQVAGLDVRNVNPQTVLIFESEAGWNLSGGAEMVVSPARHRMRANRPSVTVAFADGHVEQVTLDRMPQLRWEP